MITDKELESLKTQRFNDHEDIIHSLVEEVISLKFELHVLQTHIDRVKEILES